MKESEQQTTNGMTHQCTGCSQVWEDAQIRPLCDSEVLPQILEALDPGSVCPSGECPECNLLVYPTYRLVRPLGDKAPAIPCGIDLLPTCGPSSPGFTIPGGHGLYGSGAGACLDFYNGKAQILVDDSQGDVALHVRLNADGTIAEILVRDDLMPLVVRESAPPLTAWQAERDGEDA